MINFYKLSGFLNLIYRASLCERVCGGGIARVGWWNMSELKKEMRLFKGQIKYTNRA